MKKIIFGVTTLLMLITNASAAIHLEPYLGYAKGKQSDVLFPTEYSGIGYGARVGYSRLGLLIGATYDLAGMTAKSTTPGSNAEFDIDYTNMGAFVGYELPVGPRFWFSYYLSAKSKVSNSERSGKGLALGAGFNIIPMVLALNLEYKSYSYDERTVNGVTSQSSLGSKFLFLSISAPLGF